MSLEVDSHAREFPRHIDIFVGLTWDDKDKNCFNQKENDGKVAFWASCQTRETSHKRSKTQRGDTWGYLAPSKPFLG